MRTPDSSFVDGYSHRALDVLDDRKPSVVLADTSAQEQYARIRSVFSYELESLNTSVFLLEKIDDFPFDLFSKHPRPLFWSHVTDRLYEAAVVRIGKLVLPSRKGPSALRRFRTWLGENVNSQYRDELKARLDKVHFDQKLRSLEARIKRLRNEVFAHLDWNIVLGVSDLQGKDFVDLGELRRCCGLLCQLVDALSIGSRSFFLPVEYITTNTESDIDEILRLIAEASGVLRMPEDNPLLWKTKWETRWRADPSNLRILNEYRRLHDLPEI